MRISIAPNNISLPPRLIVVPFLLNYSMILNITPSIKECSSFQKWVYMEIPFHGKLLSSLSPAAPKACFPFIADDEFTEYSSCITVSFQKRKNAP